MKENIREKLIEAFDLDELDATFGTGEESLGSDEKSYLNRLTGIDKALHNPPQVLVPHNFVQTVLNRLPDTSVVIQKIFRLRDLAVPIFVFASLLLCILFADTLGLSTMLDQVFSKLDNSGETGLQVFFLASSSGGILFVTWLVVTSFFGIKSRRVSR